MTLVEKQIKCIELMNYHGLTDWNFFFDRAVVRFGLCSYKNKTISLSKTLTELNNWERIKNTMLHEIAHALVGPGHGHDRVWERKALEIGCDGKKYYSRKNTIQPKYKYEATCVHGKVFTRVKKPRAEYSCCCTTNGFNREFILKFKQTT